MCEPIIDPTTRAMNAGLDAVEKALETGRSLSDVEDELEYWENVDREP